MGTFKTLTTVKTIRNQQTNEVATISKVKKDGTNMIFFRVMIGEKQLTPKVYARLYTATELAKKYLNRPIKN